ncbi:RICIN domain-containing protein [Pseudomonas chlororaphis]|nr:RICIN domain-containing protein [Pseudomonas chlororaphis]
MQDKTTSSNGDVSAQTPKGPEGNNMHVPRGFYKIYSSLSYPNWLVDMSLSGGDEHNVKLFQDNDEPESRWEIYGEDNIYKYSIRNARELRLLLTHTSHGSVVAYPEGPGISERYRWSFRDAGNGFVYIVASNSGDAVLDVKGSYTANNADIITWEYAGTANQKFRLVKLD